MRSNAEDTGLVDWFQSQPVSVWPIRPGLSAGRVQRVALRIICDREDEIRGFVQDEYWSITASLLKDGQPFEARLHHIDENTIDSKSDSRSVTRKRPRLC